MKNLLLILLLSMGNSIMGVDFHKAFDVALVGTTALQAVTREIQPFPRNGLLAFWLMPKALLMASFAYAMASYTKERNLKFVSKALLILFSSEVFALSLGDFFYNWQADAPLVIGTLALFVNTLDLLFRVGRYEDI